MVSRFESGTALNAARIGSAWHGRAGRGVTWLNATGPGWARPGKTRHFPKGENLNKNIVARLGRARHGPAWHGTAGLGEVRHGEARQDTFKREET